MYDGFDHKAHSPAMNPCKATIDSIEVGNLKRSQKKKVQKFLFVFLAIEIIVLIFIFGSKRVVETVTIEAGSGYPTAELFLTNAKRKASFITDLSTITVNTPGVYTIEIRVGQRKFKSSLQVVDTTAPIGEVRSIDLVQAEEIKPEDFFASITDATDVVVSYKSAPDMSKLNTQPVALVLTDRSGNINEYETTLRISKAVHTLQVEVGTTDLAITDFLKPGVTADNITITGENVNFSQIGSYPVQLNIDGVVCDSAVEVVDTTPPVAIAVQQDGWLEKAVEAGTFVQDIQDETEVSVDYLEEPDYNRTGEQPITLVLTDAGGNKTILESILNLQPDVDPPQIYGAKKAIAYIGVPFSYKKGVYAEDNKDGEVAVTVDSSQVNLKVVGEYPVFYSAVDSSGNKTEMELTVSVIEQTVTREELDELADEILAKIITEDMTVLEKSWAVYHYIKHHVAYTGTSDKSDWMSEAKSGIVRAVGDCFTYYSMSHLLLDKIGVTALSIERASFEGEARHYWHMVNYGEGWYHFDACPHKSNFTAFMLTTEEADAFSKRIGKNEYYYRYDREKYPESEAEPTEEILALRRKE